MDVGNQVGGVPLSVLLSPQERTEVFAQLTPGLSLINVFSILAVRLFEEFACASGLSSSLSIIATHPGPYSVPTHPWTCPAIVTPDLILWTLVSPQPTW